MTKVCEKYGGAEWVSSVSDPYEYWRMVAISNPVYYISYAISAVAAVEIYALAVEDADAAFVAYTTLVEGVTPEDGFLNALKKAGLTTPFEESTYEKISGVLAK
jgi:oligoendopeptidase F